MNKQFLSWLAGFIDGDGSIYIGVRLQNANGNDYVAICPVLNLTQHIQYKWVCEYVQETLGKGKVYVANRNNASAKATWQTTKAQEMVDVLKQLLPYLIVKKSQAERVIPVLEMWIKDTALIRKRGDLRTSGMTVRRRKTVLDIVKVATTINSGMNNTAITRGYKTYEDWKPIITKLYHR